MKLISIFLGCIETVVTDMRRYIYIYKRHKEACWMTCWIIRPKIHEIYHRKYFHHLVFACHLEFSVLYENNFHVSLLTSKFSLVQTLISSTFYRILWMIDRSTTWG